DNPNSRDNTLATISFSINASVEIDCFAIIGTIIASAPIMEEWERTSMEVSKWDVDVRERVAGGIERAKCGNPVGRSPGILESRRRLRRISNLFYFLKNSHYQAICDSAQCAKRDFANCSHVCGVFSTVCVVKEAASASVERGGDAGVAVRREFQFPGDLWLPRRENRCRQPPNNHTSYDYHTPGVYTRAPELNCVPVPRVKLCKVTSGSFPPRSSAHCPPPRFLHLPPSLIPVFNTSSTVVVARNDVPAFIRSALFVAAPSKRSLIQHFYEGDQNPFRTIRRPRKQKRYSRTGIIQGKEHLRRVMPARNGDILSSRDLVLLGSPSRNFGLCKRSAYIKDQMSCYLDAINFEYLPENSHAAVTNLDVARLDYRNFRCFI
ncbi:hypothetical protein ALC60_09653, partial [Trachymyrmex zeteki]